MGSSFSNVHSKATSRKDSEVAVLAERPLKPINADVEYQFRWCKLLLMAGKLATESLKAKGACDTIFVSRSAMVYFSSAKSRLY